MEKKYGKQWVEEGLAQKRADPKLNSLLTDDEYLAIRGYTGSSYREINGALRSGNPGEWAALAHEASSGMKKLADNGYNANDPLFRDANFTPDQIKDLFPDSGVFTDKRFVSTTTVPGGVFPGNTKIVVVENQSGVSVSRISIIPSEAEILFKPNTSFDIISVARDPTTGKNIIVLRERP